jgi:hypothetical protein
MTLSVQRFAEWQKANRKIEEAREWMAHIGKQGRGTDVLRISPAHCTAPKFSIAGQYTAGGQNYRESPSDFNVAIRDVVIRRFGELAAEAVALMEADARKKLIEAESEIAEIQSAISSAKEQAA